MRQFDRLTNIDEPNVAGMPQHVVLAQVGVDDPRRLVHSFHHVDGLRVRRFHLR